jgi:hypothetical protein
MAWEKATYWMAVGLLAVMAGNAFVNRHEEWVRDLSDHSLQVAQEVSGRAMAYVNLAEMTLGRDQTRFVGAQTKVACVQARLASMEVAMARSQAGLAKLASERARLQAMEQMRPRLICPRRGFAIAIPQPHPMSPDDTI